MLVTFGPGSAWTHEMARETVCMHGHPDVCPFKCPSANQPAFITRTVGGNHGYNQMEVFFIFHII